MSYSFHLSLGTWQAKIGVFGSYGRYWWRLRQCPYFGGIFAQGSMDVNAVNVYNWATGDLENVQDISYALHSIKYQVTLKEVMSSYHKKLKYGPLNFKEKYVNKCRSNQMPLIVDWPWKTHLILIADDIFFSLEKTCFTKMQSLPWLSSGYFVMLA